MSKRPKFWWFLLGILVGTLLVGVPGLIYHRVMRLQPSTSDRSAAIGNRYVIGGRVISVLEYGGGYVLSHGYSLVDNDSHAPCCVVTFQDDLPVPPLPSGTLISVRATFVWHHRGFSVFRDAEELVVEKENKP